jgi:hypothetical protein
MVQPEGFQVLLKPDLPTLVTLKPVAGPQLFTSIIKLCVGSYKKGVVKVMSNHPADEETAGTEEPEKT